MILLGEIFREEKRQVFVKRLVRQVRREFFSKDFKRLLHYKEILMNLEAVKNLEDVEALAEPCLAHRMGMRYDPTGEAPGAC